MTAADPESTGAEPSDDIEHVRDAAVVEVDPYPAAARPSFDIPVSAPVSAHAPVPVQTVREPRADHASDASTAVDATAGTAQHGAHPSRRKTDPGHRASSVGVIRHTDAPRSKGARRAVVALSVLLVAALAGAAYLGVLANQWEERSGQWESQSRTLGSNVADLTADLGGMTSELALVREQLATAQTRITELADEKAQVGDDRESQKLLADDVQEVAQTALDVSSALGDCVTAQSTVLGYLTAPQTATPEVLQTAATQANTVCAAAIADYDALRADLADQ